MTSASLVSLRNVGKAFANGIVALDGLDLDVREGEFLSLLGPSGCGKSTALRIIAGLSGPSAGEVDWRDNSLRRQIGFVFQEPTLMPWATVADNVRLPLKLRGESATASAPRVQEALERVGLTAFAGAYPRELSGGMKMRASVARALVTRPRLLLLDEPFAALDEITRNRMNDDLLNLWRQRRWAGLFITHSVFESVYLSTRVLVMSPRPGRVVDEIAIDLPETRTAETRTSPRYIELCRRVSRALESSAEAMAEAAHA